MNIIKLLKKDHDAVRALFSRFDRARSSVEKRTEIFDQIRRELLVHSQVEQEIFYPIVKAVDDKGRSIALEALREHREIEELLIQIARLKGEDPRFIEKVETLMDSVDHHIEEEEGQIFQFVEENCPEDELVSAGRNVDLRKKAIEREIAA